MPKAHALLVPLLSMLAFTSLMFFTPATVEETSTLLLVVAPVIITSPVTMYKLSEYVHPVPLETGFVSPR